MTKNPNSSLIAKLPSVDRLVRSEVAATLVETYGRLVVTRQVKKTLQSLREARLAGQDVDTRDELILNLVASGLAHAMAPTLRRVLNLTGTVLHTNLGRAALPEEALDAVADVAKYASSLEYDVSSGRRGDRDDHLESTVLSLTGGEAATVVNNNAAAVMLVLNTLALGHEVPVSRGELVEIGGSFRVPEIMTRSGCKLVEVGTTNRTHLKDFERAIGSNTGLVMKIHTSNYAIEGFTASVPEPELAALCNANETPFVIDLGAGSLVDMARYGLPHEPTPSEALRAGADLVTFSADKLLGGPQAGIIVGRKDLIERLRSNPMKRALRCDKMTIAALAAVLRLYGDPDRLRERLPTLRRLTRTKEEIGSTARLLVEPISRQLKGIATVSIVDCDSVIGSGALPTRTLPSIGIGMRPCGTKRGGGELVGQISKAFAMLPIPVIGRVTDGTFVLDLRCLEVASELSVLINHLDVKQGKS